MNPEVEESGSGGWSFRTPRGPARHRTGSVLGKCPAASAGPSWRLWRGRTAFQTLISSVSCTVEKDGGDGSLGKMEGNADPPKAGPHLVATLPSWARAPGPRDHVGPSSQRGPALGPLGPVTRPGPSATPSPELSCTGWLRPWPGPCQSWCPRPALSLSADLPFVPEKLLFCWSELLVTEAHQRTELDGKRAPQRGSGGTGQAARP